MVTLYTFDLCKQLHELKPGWTPEDRLFIRRKGDNPEIVKDPKFVYRVDQAPRFTVDYLLEKLPNRITNSCIQKRLDGGLHRRHRPANAGQSVRYWENCTGRGIAAGYRDG